MKRFCFVSLLLMTSLLFLSANDAVVYSADNVTSLEVAFASNLSGYIGFSKRVVASSYPVPETDKQGTLELELTDGINFVSHSVFLYWQLFTTTPVKVHFTEIPPLKQIAMEGEELPTNPSEVGWEMEYLDDKDAKNVSSTNTPDPNDESLIIYSDENKEQTKPRIGSREVVFSIPESQLNNVKEVTYQCQITIAIEALQ